MRISVFIDDQEFSFEGSYDTYFQYNSYVEVCPVCLKIWARVHLESPSWFYVETSPCEDCPWPWQNSGVPGSLLQSGHGRGPVKLFDILPLPLLEREFRIHMKHYGVILNDSYKLNTLKARIAARRSEARGDFTDERGESPLWR